jgi:hypothetical protein
MSGLDADQVVRAALVDAGRTLTRLPGRQVTSGLLEMKEFAPALRDSLERTGVGHARVRLNHTTEIAHWSRPTSQVDLVVLGENASVDIAAELKVWEIGHQLFDLAKACCLLGADVASVFLVCVAKRDEDFRLMPGGQLFPAREGDARVHRFAALIEECRDEWSRHVGRGGPEPTSLSRAVRTHAVATSVAIDAYPGHSARAVKVVIADSTPIELMNGWPAASG